MQHFLNSICRTTFPVQHFCAAFSVQDFLYIIYYTAFSVQNLLYRIFCTAFYHFLYRIYCAAFYVHSFLYSILCTAFLRSIFCTTFFVKLVLKIAQASTQTRICSNGIGWFGGAQMPFMAQAGGSSTTHPTTKDHQHTARDQRGATNANFIHGSDRSEPFCSQLSLGTVRARRSFMALIALNPFAHSSRSALSALFRFLVEPSCGWLAVLSSPFSKSPLRARDAST